MLRMLAPSGALLTCRYFSADSQDKYGYTGKPRLLSDPMLQCDMCEQWFFLNELQCVPKEASFVPFQRNYRFSCRICTGGTEQFELQTNTWTSIALTAIYNLLLSDDGTSLQAGVWLKITDVVAWVQNNWGGLTMGRNQAQMLENSAISKCLLYTQSTPAPLRVDARLLPTMLARIEIRSVYPTRVGILAIPATLTRP